MTTDREYPARVPGYGWQIPDAGVRAAAKYGRSRGLYGKPGGWIYSPTSHRPICQGWRSYAERLAASRRLYLEAGHWHVEER